MDQTRLVCRGQYREDLSGDAGRPVRRYVVRLGEQRADRAAGHQLHHYLEINAVAEVVDRGYSRAVQSRGDPGFAVEPTPGVAVIGEFGGDQLDGDITVEAQVFRSPHLTHVAAPDGGGGAVPVREGSHGKNLIEERFEVC